jgi:hypothetical protein
MDEDTLDRFAKRRESIRVIRYNPISMRSMFDAVLNMPLIPILSDRPHMKFVIEHAPHNRRRR